MFYIINRLIGIFFLLISIIFITGGIATIVMTTISTSIIIKDILIGMLILGIAIILLSYGKEDL